MTDRLYYSDPIAAIHMAKEFGVKYLTPSDWYVDPKKGHLLVSWETDWTSIREYIIIYDVWQGHGIEGFNAKFPEISYLKFYIHPDSLDIYQPKVGDKDEDGYEVVSSIVMSGHFDRHRTLSEDLKNFKTARRNNKPFFWPEREDDR